MKKTDDNYRTARASRASASAGISAAALFAAGVLATSLAPAPFSGAAAQGIVGGGAQAALGHAACEASKSEKFKQALSSGVVPKDAAFGGVVNNVMGEALDAPVKIVTGLIKKNTSPFCATESPQATLLLTGAMIDEATLSAADAISLAMDALNIRNDLKADIQGMRAAAGGEFGLAGESSDFNVFTQRVGAGALDVATQLAAMQANGSLSPALREVIVDVNEKLGESVWFQIQSGLGVSALTGVLGGLSTQQGEALAEDSQVGLQSEFAQKLPSRLENLVTNTAKILVIQRTAFQLADEDLQKDLKKSDKKARKAAKKKGKALVAQANENAGAIPM